MEDHMAKAAPLVSTRGSVRKAKPRKPRPQKPAGYDLASWLDGYEAGCLGGFGDPPKTFTVNGVTLQNDPTSWQAGNAEGYGQHRQSELAHALACAEGGRLAMAFTDYLGIGTAAYHRGFKQGLRLAARQAWRLP